MTGVPLTLYTHTGQPVQYTRPAAKATFNLSTGPGVSWAAWTWNPITGCLHGCTYCYARSIALHYTNAFPAGFTPLFHEERLDAPANTRIPAKHRDDPAFFRSFVVSMGDMFGRWVPRVWIDRILAVEHAHPQWEYLHLSKFPDRYPELDMPATAWVGTSVDEQARVRIAERAMSKVDNVKVRWLSLEPYPKQPLRFHDLSMFDWVVIGARTATNQPHGREPAYAPPAHLIMDITEQAKAAGCAVHWKPNLRTNPGTRGALPAGVWFDEYPPVQEGPPCTP